MDVSSFLILFFKGMVIGFSIAAPVGPVGILCIRKTLSNHKILAILTGLGSACADAFYGTVAAFSLAGITDFIAKNEFYLKLFGGILIGWIGFAVIKHPSHKKTEGIEGIDSILHVFTSAFVLTISNPITLLVFAAAFAAMGVTPIYQSFSQALFLVAGIFIGAMCWWTSLIIAIYLLRHRLSEAQLLWINHFSGVILIGFSIYILMSLI